MIKKCAAILMMICVFARACEAIVGQKDLRMLVQKGHSNVIDCIAFNPTGKYIVSSSWDDAVKIWNLEGNLIQTIQVKGIREVLYSPNGEYILGVGDENTYLWNTYGESVATIRTKCVRGRFSPDSKYVACVGSEDDLELWSLKGVLVTTFRGQAAFTDVSFAPNGKWLATSTKDKQIQLWGMNGKLIREFSVEPKYTGPYGSLSVYVGPKGDSIISIFVPPVERDAEIKLWNIDGKFLKFVGNYDAYDMSQQPFSADWKFMTGVSENLQLKVWETTGKLITALPRFSDYLQAPVLSPDGKHVAAIINEREVGVRINVWDVNGNFVRSIGGNSSSVTRAAVSPDGRYIAAGSSTGKVKIWGMDGKLIKSLAGSSRRKFRAAVDSVAISPDGKYMASCSQGEVTVWDADGRSVSTFKNYGYGLAFSPDGKYIVTGGGAGSNNETSLSWHVKIWDIDGKQYKCFYGHTAPVHTVSFSSDGKHVLSGSWDGTVRAWNIATGDVKVILDTGGQLNSVSFSGDGKYIVTATRSGIIKLWAASGKLWQTLGAEDCFWLGGVKFSADGKYVAAGRASGITIWDINGNPVKTLQGDAAYGGEIAFSPDGKHILAGAIDGTIKLWNIETGNYFSMLGDENSEEWIMYAADGYFDASPHGGELVAMAGGPKVYGIEQFAARNNRPDLILERMGLGTEEQITHFQLQYQKRIKKLGLTEAHLTGELHLPQAEIIKAVRNGKFLNVGFSLSDDKYALKRYNFFVNNVPLFGPSGKEIHGNAFAGAENVELTAGENKVELSVMNEAGVESYRALTYARLDDAKKGALYFLAFGISEYKAPSLRLNYADKDAKDLEAEILQMRPEFSGVHTRTFLNSEGTAGNIKKAKDFLKTAGVDDTVILFVAGHGGYDKGKAPQYYYLPYDADPDNLTNTGVVFEDIEDLLNNIKPRKKLFLLDTCESGELDDDVYAQYYSVANARGFKPRAYRKPGTARGQVANKSRGYLLEKNRFIYNDLARRSGAVVFSSSRGTEISYESSAIKNGFFSREIINALRNKAADKDGNGKINVNELKAYVSEAVAKDTGGLQNPTIDRDNLFQKIELPLLSN